MHPHHTALEILPLTASTFGVVWGQHVLLYLRACARTRASDLQCVTSFMVLMFFVLDARKAQ